MDTKEAAKKLFDILHDDTYSWTQNSVDAFKLAITALEENRPLKNRCFAILRGMMCDHCKMKCPWRKLSEAKE